MTSITHQHIVENFCLGSLLSLSSRHLTLCYDSCCFVDALRSSQQYFSNVETGLIKYQMEDKVS